MAVDLGHVGRRDPEQGQVTERVLDHPQLTVLDQMLLRRAVPDGEQLVLVDRDDEGPGGDPAEGGGQVPAGVAIMPGRLPCRSCR